MTEIHRIQCDIHGCEETCAIDKTERWQVLERRSHSPGIAARKSLLASSDICPTHVSLFNDFIEGRVVAIPLMKEPNYDDEGFAGFEEEYQDAQRNVIRPITPQERANIYLDARPSPIRSLPDDDIPF